jgi:hypothetical protein
MASHWIILRCSPSKTLRLAESLAADGFDVWTPVTTERVDVPRMNAKREVRLPMLGGFVFAGSRHLLDMLDLAAMPVKPRRGAGLMMPAHADFSVFHHLDRIPLIDDRELNALRRIARRRTIAPKAAALKKYQIVRVEDEGNCFQGKTGVVQASNPKETAVCFDGRWSVKISTFILRPVAVEDGLHAARKAA